MYNIFSKVERRHLFFTGGVVGGGMATWGVNSQLPPQRAVRLAKLPEDEPRPLAAEQALSMAASVAMTTSLGLQTGAGKYGATSNKSLLYTVAFAAPTFSSLAMNAFVKSENEASEHLLGLGILGATFYGTNAAGQHAALKEKNVKHLAIAATGVAVGIVLPTSVQLVREMAERVSAGVKFNREHDL